MGGGDTSASPGPERYVLQSAFGRILGRISSIEFASYQRSPLSCRERGLGTCTRTVKESVTAETAGHQRAGHSSLRGGLSNQQSIVKLQGKYKLGKARTRSQNNEQFTTVWTKQDMEDRSKLTFDHHSSL